MTAADPSDHERLLARALEHLHDDPDGPRVNR
jgi:hypothetical protein